MPALSDLLVKAALGVCARLLTTPPILAPLRMRVCVFPTVRLFHSCSVECFRAHRANDDVSQCALEAARIAAGATSARRAAPPAQLPPAAELLDADTLPRLGA